MEKEKIELKDYLSSKYKNINTTDKILISFGEYIGGGDTNTI